MKLLILEDDDVQNEMYCTLLQQAGITNIVSALTPEDALKHTDIDIALLDINMSRATLSTMNGIDVAAALLKIKKIPIIFFTAYKRDNNDYEQRIKNEIRGHFYFVSKTGFTDRNDVFMDVMAGWIEDAFRNFQNKGPFLDVPTAIDQQGADSRKIPYKIVLPLGKTDVNSFEVEYINALEKEDGYKKERLSIGSYFVIPLTQVGIRQSIPSKGVKINLSNNIFGFHFLMALENPGTVERAICEATAATEPLEGEDCVTKMESGKIKGAKFDYNKIITFNVDYIYYLNDDNRIERLGLLGEIKRNIILNKFHKLKTN